MAMAETMFFSYDGLDGIKSNLAKAEEEIQNAFSYARAVFTNLKDDESWTGLTRNEYIAFLHLVLQYHGVLIGEKMEILGTVDTVSIDDNPMEMMKEAFTKLLTKMNDYENIDEVEEYRELKKI